jgi:hypothetical protein
VAAGLDGPFERAPWSLCDFVAAVKKPTKPTSRPTPPRAWASRVIQALKNYSAEQRRRNSGLSSRRGSSTTATATLTPIHRPATLESLRNKSAATARLAVALAVLIAGDALPVRLADSPYLQSYASSLGFDARAASLPSSRSVAKVSRAKLT